MIAWQYCVAVCCRAGWINCNIHTSSAPWPPSPDTNALIPVVTERRAGSVCGAAGPTLSALPTAGHPLCRCLSPTLLPQCPQAGPLGLSSFLPCREVHQCQCSRFQFYFNAWYLGVWFLTYFILCNRLWVHPPHFSWFNHSFLWLSDIPLYIFRCTTTSLSILLSPRWFLITVTVIPK